MLPQPRPPMTTVTAPASSLQAIRTQMDLNGWGQGNPASMTTKTGQRVRVTGVCGSAPVLRCRP